MATRSGFAFCALVSELKRQGARTARKIYFMV